MELKNFTMGLLLGVLLVGCAGAAKFGYKYYGLDLPDYDGKLLGPAEKDDLPFRQCQPDDFVTASDVHDLSKGKCVVLFSDEFFRLKADLMDTRQKLIECQKK